MFKAKVTGKPQPGVNWERASGCPLSDAAKSFCDNINNQHILKVWHCNHTARSVAQFLKDPADSFCFLKTNPNLRLKKTMVLMLKLGL